jgi:uncharacterized protein YcsI (UPF0317 family)
VPGVPFSFELAILDQQNNIYLGESSAVAYLNLNCTDCGTLTGNKVIANKGIFNFTSVILKTVPGSDV